LVAGYFRLYRAVSPQELADISSFGGFRPIPSSLQGKWFAEAADHASEWGGRVYQHHGGPYHIVQLDVPKDVADMLFWLPNLDQIGSARYAEGDLLDAVNQTNLGITEVPTIGGIP